MFLTPRDRRIEVWIKAECIRKYDGFSPNAVHIGFSSNAKDILQREPFFTKPEQKKPVMDAKNQNSKIRIFEQKNLFSAASWSCRTVPQQMKVCERTDLCCRQYAYRGNPTQLIRTEPNPAQAKKNGQICDKQIGQIPVFEQKKLGFVPLRGALEESPSK